LLGSNADHEQGKRGRVKAWSVSGKGQGWLYKHSLVLRVDSPAQVRGAAVSLGKRETGKSWLCIFLHL